MIKFSSKNHSLKRNVDYKHSYVVLILLLIPLSYGCIAISHSERISKQTQLMESYSPKLD